VSKSLLKENNLLVVRILKVHRGRSQITSRLREEKLCDSPNTRNFFLWKIFQKKGGVKKVILRDVIYVTTPYLKNLILKTKNSAYVPALNFITA